MIAPLASRLYLSTQRPLRMMLFPVVKRFTFRHVLLRSSKLCSRSLAFFYSLYSPVCIAAVRLGGSYTAVIAVAIRMNSNYYLALLEA
jgi:hypothetical protein